MPTMYVFDLHMSNGKVQTITATSINDALAQADYGPAYIWKCLDYNVVRKVEVKERED